MTMQGRRVYPGVQGFSWENGDYGYWEKGKAWYCRTPNGHLGNLASHDVTEHEDGTITVSPSIGVYTTDVEGKEVQVWHGYLERGVWREV